MAPGPDETEYHDEGETGSMAAPTVDGVPSAKAGLDVREAARIAPGDRIGRYVVSGELGLGGMGVVLDAHDPDLNRRVAIKMLRPAAKRSGAFARDRLLREAQALARLSHPNVVAVYDVGSIPAGIYVAMEYVSGPTVRQWLEQERRTPAEVLRVFGEAGRGLAAAHAAGLVHRDFKPANVIIGDDGRVRVLDFGLARAAHLADADVELDDAPTPDNTPLPRSERADRLDTPITQFGTVVGTPRYMAPEQYKSASVGAPADVFAFCVALYEALYGRHPYGKSTGREARLRAGSLDDTPAIDGVPAHVRRIMLRGLAEQPDARPDMAELLRELARDRWRVWRYAAGGLALVAASAFAVVMVERTGGAAAPCTDGETRLAGVWDDAARAAVRDRFASVQLPHVDATGHRVVLMLDDYARRWAVKRDEVCAATDIEHKQSAQLMDQRMACLDARRTQLAALASGLVDRKNDGAIDSALSATASLLDLDGCDDVEHFGPTVALPTEPAARREVVAVRAEMAKIEAEIGLGGIAAGLPKARALAARADATGFLPVRAEAADFLAYARLEAGDFDGIEPLLESLVTLGAQAKNDDIVATGWIEIMRLRGTVQAKTADALALRFAAEAALHRAGDAPRLEGDYYNALSDVYDTGGDYPASRDAQLRVLEILKKTRGPRHVMVGAALVNLGGTQFALGDYDSALGYFQEALAIYEEQVGPDSPKVAIALTNIAEVLTQKRRFDEARPMLERALAIKERALGPTHTGVAITLLGLADVYVQQRRYAEALPLLRRSHAIMSAALAADHPHVATTAASLGGALVRLGKFDEGCALIAPAVPILTRTYGVDGAALAIANQAECETHAGHGDAAVALLAPALTGIDKGKLPREAALVRFRTAQALAVGGARPPRSIALARDAEALLASDGDAGADDLADVRAWLAAR